MTVRRGIILAAGLGSRLADGSGVPKPLVKVGGRSLIEHVLAAFEGAGLTEAVVVVGFQGDRIREAVSGERGIRVEVVENAEWKKSNGVSVLAAAGKLDQPCVLSMSDHLYGAGLVRALSGVPDDDESCQLLVDGDVAGVFDIDDATKVRREGDRIVAIGKDLTEYDGIDCGVFRVTSALVEALGEAYGERGDCSLSDGVRRLCERDRMRAVAVSGEAWLDVDTPEALRQARVLLRAGAFGTGLAVPGRARPRAGVVLPPV